MTEKPDYEISSCHVRVDKARIALPSTHFLAPVPIPPTPEAWSYLSFADDDGFIGCCVVRGSDTGECVTRAWALDINPGGQVLCYTLPPDELAKVPASCREVLFRGKAGAAAFFAQSGWGEAKSIREREAETGMTFGGDLVCESCADEIKPTPAEIEQAAQYVRDTFAAVKAKKANGGDA